VAKYKGYQFPFQKSGSAVPLVAIPPQLLAASIKQILLTEQGERVMRPSFGTTLRRRLFENVTPSLVKEIQQEIVGALAKWEPRVEVTLVEVFQDENNPSLVTANVQYISLGKQSETGPVLIGAG
jgi:hypothetical protein